MHFEKGQLLSLIALSPKDGNDAAAVRQSYLQNAFGLASDFGLKPAGSMSVAKRVAGDFSPVSIAFFAWPNQAAEARFRAQPEWLPIKATRPGGWDELRVHDVILEQDLTLNFDGAKTYTLATAWINPQRPDDYDQYLANIEPAVRASGGRYFYQMHEPRFASHATTDGGAPGRVTLVEWNTSEGLADFQKTAGFKANVARLQSGTTRFELLVLGAPGG